MNTAVEMHVIDFIDRGLHAVQQSCMQRRTARGAADDRRLRGTAELFDQRACLSRGIRIETRERGARPVENRKLGALAYFVGQIFVTKTGNELTDLARCI